MSCGCVVVPIVTGVIDTRTRNTFREGESHVMTPDGQVISLQDQCRQPEAVMGEKVTAFAESLFGEATWPIV